MTASNLMLTSLPQAVESESSVEEEGELLSEGEQDRERDARQDSVPIASAEELLARYSAPHNATPHNATLDNTSILSDWFTETKLPQVSNLTCAFLHHVYNTNAVSL